MQRAEGIGLVELSNGHGCSSSRSVSKSSAAHSHPFGRMVEPPEFKHAQCKSELAVPPLVPPEAVGQSRDDDQRDDP
jgi:hypothetical protein